MRSMRNFHSLQIGQRLTGVIAFACLLAGLSACQEQTDSATSEPPVRSLKTIEIRDVEQTTIRRFPSVLQPGSITTLSFEISGRLKEITLDVGQQVKKGDVIAEIDERALELAVETAQASLTEATAQAKNDATNAERQEALRKKDIVTQSTLDQALTKAESSAARVVQAQRALEDTQDNLGKAKLVSPIDGTINSVEIQSFANVTAGTPVATVYAVEAFETSFSVSYEVVNRLAVGKQVQVRLADNPQIVLSGTVSELGARADTVSSFPVVVRLSETHPSLKAGMAVEISIEFNVPRGQGFALPISVLPFEGQIERPSSPNQPGKTHVYVYDPATSTVAKRQVTVGGVRENALVVIDGLEVGDLVASAGVSFLRDGQKVKLFEQED